MLLQAMADQFGIPVKKYAEVAFEARLAPKFSYGCAVFLDTDRVNFQKEGFSKEEMLAGLAQVLPKNVWQYVVQIPRLAALGTKYVLQGGTQYNLAAVKAQVDLRDAAVSGFIQPSLMALRDTAGEMQTPILRDLVSDQFEYIETTVATVASMRDAVTRAATIVRELPLDDTKLAA